MRLRIRRLSVLRFLLRLRDKLSQSFFLIGVGHIGTTRSSEDAGKEDRISGDNLSPGDKLSGPEP